MVSLIEINQGKSDVLLAASDLRFGLRAILLIKKIKTKQIDELKRAHTKGLDDERR